MDLSTGSVVPARMIVSIKTNWTEEFVPGMVIV